MKKTKITFVFISIFLITIFTSGAEAAMNWYIVRRGNSTPNFPPNASEIEKLGGIYIDKKSACDGEKKLYLTFDAGYENGNIERILDVMKEENVRGAFFILSNLIDKNPELVRRLSDEGHLVCNHTYNHKDMTTLTDDEILSNLERLEKKYEDVTGKKMEKIFRFPEGRYSTRVLELLYDNGYKSVFWSMAYDDWDNSRQMSTEKAKRKLLSMTHDGAIILLHPTSATNAEILGDLIREWKSQGYTFGTLDAI